MHPSTKTLGPILVRTRPQPTADSRQDEHAEPAVQILETGSRKALLIRVHCLVDDQFREAIGGAQPSHIFDLRIDPRLDVGNLNRRSAFLLFEEVGAAYVDLGGQPNGWDARQVRPALEAILRGVDAGRTVVFLFSTYTGSLLRPSEVVTALACCAQKLSAIPVNPAAS